MRIVSASVCALRIPFVETFRHSLSSRNHSDSVVVTLTTESGLRGYGEGVPRAYVTGENVESSVTHIQTQLLPKVVGIDIDTIDTGNALACFEQLIPCPTKRNPHDGAVAASVSEWSCDSLTPSTRSRSLLHPRIGSTTSWSETDRHGIGIIWNASRCAVEFAFLDCLLRHRNLSLAALLPPNKKEVTYSAVITAGSARTIHRIAQRCRDAAFSHIKLKVSRQSDLEHVAAVRDIMGPDASIRLDANGAFSPESAARFASAADRYGIDSFEQPVPCNNVRGLAALRRTSTLPIMADESVVTLDDARRLIHHGAVDAFNLRISKCGGLLPTLCIAKLAASAGVAIQLGCQVGETAILSAAGRHIAAHLKDTWFVEGSYGTHLLREDVAACDISFALGGTASLLGDPGLGIAVRDDIIRKHATCWKSVPPATGPQT